MGSTDKALLFDAIHEQINELADVNRGRQVNLQRFRKFNHVRIDGNGNWIDGYCVRVTPKHVYFVRLHKIFDRDPTVERVRNAWGVVHVRPYIRNVVEVVRNWRFGRFGE